MHVPVVCPDVHVSTTLELYLSPVLYPPSLTVALASYLPYGPAIAEHVVLGAGLDPSTKLSKVRGTLELTVALELHCAGATEVCILCRLPWVVTKCLKLKAFTVAK